MIVRINPPLFLDTPRGHATAHFLIDYSQEHDLLWVTFVDDTGECWTFRNDQIRMRANQSLRPDKAGAPAA